MQPADMKSAKAGNSYIRGQDQQQVRLPNKKMKFDDSIESV
jgi:hypothetical protein